MAAVHSYLRRVARIGAAALASVAIGLCAIPSAARAADKVSVGLLRFVSGGPVFLAFERGYFKDAGLDVDLKFFEAAQPIAVAVVSGDVAYGATAFTGGFFNLAGKGALKIIAAQSKEQKGFEGNAILVSNAAWDKGFQKLSDFPGHSLGITQVGSSFHYQIGQLARVAGFDLKSVNLKPLQSLPNMAAALKGNQVDAIIIAPNIAKPLVAAGTGHLIGWYSDYDEYQFGGLFTATSTVQNKRELTLRFVRAYQRGSADYAAAFMQRDASGKRNFDAASEDAAKIIAKYVYPGDPLEKSVPLVEASAFPADPQARLDVGDIYTQIAWLKSQGLVDASVDPKTTLDLSFVEGHYNIPK
ncbi:MAG TPA: ABC transporter substrate-binding protein [Beijerinckiaceae bacterium]|nr:ABC transporter substrate-binding protein [Beijerinckiaceae bacterium]